MFHQFPKLNNGVKTLVRSIDFDYKFSNLYSSNASLNQSSAEVTYLVGITQRGYVKNENTYSIKALPKMTFNENHKLKAIVLSPEQRSVAQTTLNSMKAGPEVKLGQTSYDYLFVEKLANTIMK